METNYRTKINYVSEKGLFIETGSRIRIVRYTSAIEVLIGRTEVVIQLGQLVRSLV